MQYLYDKMPWRWFVFCIFEGVPLPQVHWISSGETDREGVDGFMIVGTRTRWLLCLSFTNERWWRRCWPFSDGTREMASLHLVRAHLSRPVFDPRRETMNSPRTQGGAMANMYALPLARYKFFPEVKEKGMAHLQSLTIFTSQDVRIFLLERICASETNIHSLLLACKRSSMSSNCHLHEENQWYFIFLGVRSRWITCRQRIYILGSFLEIPDNSVLFSSHADRKEEADPIVLVVI